MWVLKKEVESLPLQKKKEKKHRINKTEPDLLLQNFRFHFSSTMEKKETLNRKQALCALLWLAS